MATSLKMATFSRREALKLCDLSELTHSCSKGLMVEAQLMATVSAIALAIDALWASQWAQATLELRVEQIANEKERLLWEKMLTDRQSEALYKLQCDSSRRSRSRGSSTTSDHAPSHYTAKVG